MAKLTKRQVERLSFEAKQLALIPELSNSFLLEEYTCLAGGDDYDGCYTPHGEKYFGLLREELNKRLVACGFLTENDTVI